jgi:hypothetical protein
MGVCGAESDIGRSLSLPTRRLKARRIPQGRRATELRIRDGTMAACGPRLTTWALQQVVSFLGYCGRAVNVAATAYSDPQRRKGDALINFANVRPLDGSFRSRTIVMADRKGCIRLGNPCEIAGYTSQ